MDNLEAFFSTEALRLLAQGQGFQDVQDLFSIGYRENPSVDDFHCTHDDTTCAPTEARFEKKDLHLGATLGYSTFLASTDERRSRKRAKFEDPKRRAAVAQVRKEGACMRCRWYKVPVSEILEDLSLASTVLH